METCYRHPKVETAVSCSGCGRPICPDCMTPSPVGMRCPECAPQRTRATKAVERRMNSDTPLLTFIIIGICVALEFGVLSSGGSAAGGGGNGVVEDLSLVKFFVADGEYYRLLTSGFLHHGIAHLLFNMLALYVIGSMLEPAIGRLRFALIYFVSLFAGSLGALMMQGEFVQTAGASGAVFGIMGGAILVLRNRGIDPMASGLPFWLGINLLLTFTISGISIGGHIGGLIGGVAAAWVLFELPSQARGLPRYVPSLLAAGLGAVAIVASVAVA